MQRPTHSAEEPDMSRTKLALAAASLVGMLLALVADRHAQNLYVPDGSRSR